MLPHPFALLEMLVRDWVTVPHWTRLARSRTAFSN